MMRGYFKEYFKNDARKLPSQIKKVPYTTKNNTVKYLEVEMVVE